MQAANGSAVGWPATYAEIKTKHDAAYGSMHAAISLEEQEKPEEAIKKYKEGIALIDEALRVQVTCPERPDFTWEKACAMIQKMKKSRAEALMRIHSIQADLYPDQGPTEQPPSYEEAISNSIPTTPTTPTTPSTPQTYHDLATALNHLRMESNIPLMAEVIYIYENVKLYFISPNGEVSSTLKPQTLKIILVENEGANVPRAILQVGDWVYPLISGVSPCYRTDYGAFILPNVYSEAPGSAIGIILPPDADADVYDVLENILYGIVGQPKAAPAPEGFEEEHELGHRISSGIVTGASYLSTGLVKGAEKLGGLINQGAPKLMSKMSHAERPTEIPPKVTRGMQIAETATNKAAQVTGFVADQIGAATTRLGRFLAPHIQKQGTRLLSTGLGMSEKEASTKVRGVLTVAAGAVEGFSTVYRGLEDSASILRQNLKENTVKVVQHKYGHPAGEFTEDTLNTFGNVYQISRNARVIRPAHLARQTAKEAGKSVVYEYRSFPNDGAGSSGASNMNHPSNGEKDLAKKP